SWQEASDALGGLPKIKTHCSVLAVDGLRAAIQNYEEKHGLIKEKIPTTKEIILKRLRHVMNPLAGLDLVRTNLITGVTVENGTIEVTVNLPEEHQFANNIREEIVEKLENLWDIDKVVVNFTD
ncbi:MAG: iron-sulfur cluster assembly protein, partial [candidate division WOR-3 bacterium]